MGATVVRVLPPEMMRELLREGLQIIDTREALPDGQFRLRGCRCGSEDVVYLRIRDGSREPWMVRCLACGAQGERKEICHEAQVDWNTNKAVKPIIRRVI